MFDQVKNLNKLKKAQSEMKKELEQIFVSEEKRGYKVVIRGDKKIQKLEIDGTDQKDLREFINDVMKKTDKKVEKQMRSHLSDLGIPGLS